MSKRQTVLAVSGIKNSGKTTLIESLIPLLADKGIETAVIKHDGHSYAPDVPGTDSHRFFAAGALGCAVFDGEKFSLTRRGEISELQLISAFPLADLILLEGFKSSDYPKLELVRKGVSQGPVCEPESCLAYVSELELETDKTVLSPLDIGGIAEFIIEYMKGGGENA